MNQDWWTTHASTTELATQTTTTKSSTVSPFQFTPLLFCRYLFTMVCLEEIAAIGIILKTAPASTVQLLHKIVNDEPYSKSSRKELKKFAGFPQNYDIEARKDKILKDFTKTDLITVCTILGLNCAGSAKELSEHIFKNLSDLASIKNNFTEQLTDDEDEDSAPFSLESTNDANKQPLNPSIFPSPSPQDVFVPPLQTQRNQSQRGNEERMHFC
ncbi:hypothetical protein TNCV_590121 [Trichonephila clavipes]|nr:hypothetical protein TNCV_590121 [Trichonephila clavipes]